ncbi:hypothetical protein [Aquifex aeolicus]|uniref:hypothetical protein n=1 Tax=Aquifex aeolicus TaxID=63363 RepID=UPI00030CFD21|nr:hypothetical protein [Aquifex aeolicus]
MDDFSFRDEARFKRLAKKWKIVNHIVQEEEEEKREAEKKQFKRTLTIEDLRNIFKNRSS